MSESVKKKEKVTWRDPPPRQEQGKRWLVVGSRRQWGDNGLGFWAISQWAPITVYIFVVFLHNQQVRRLNHVPCNCSFELLYFLFTFFTYTPLINCKITLQSHNIQTKLLKKKNPCIFSLLLYSPFNFFF